MRPVVSAPALGRRLSGWLAIQILLGLSLLCSVVYFVTAMTLAQRQDETLNDKVAMVRHLLSKAQAGTDAAALQHAFDDLLAGHEEMALRLDASDGRKLYASSLPFPAGRSVKHRVFRYEEPGQPWSVDAVLSLRTVQDDALLRRLAWTLALASAIGALVVSLGSFWLVRLGLAPLRQLVEQIRDLSARDLDRRLDGTTQPRELQPLIEQFNALLDRLSHSYAQMKGFNADVAHELKTPLATLISSSELGLRKTRGIDELRELLGSNLEELHRMSGIVNDMLFLSQADRGADARKVEVSSLQALAAEVIEFHEAALQEADLAAELRGDAAGWFDAALLRRALSNLLGNATRFAEPGSTIQVQIERHGPSEVVIAVCNQGRTIAPADLPRVFDRFHRADPARAHGDRNHGLGLAIVAAIAWMHGGRATAESAAGLTRVGLTLPTGRAPTRADERGGPAAAQR